MKKSYSARTIILAGSLLLQLSALCFQSRGADGDVDLSFDPGSDVNGQVNAVAVQPDGKVLIGGAFTTVKGLARSKVARLNVDGSGDSSFDAGTELEAWGYAVRAVALQSDGKVLVGHDYGITRLNSDGRLDNSFNPGTGIGSRFSVPPPSMSHLFRRVLELPRRPLREAARRRRSPLLNRRTLLT